MWYWSLATGYLRHVRRPEAVCAFDSNEPSGAVRALLLNTLYLAESGPTGKSASGVKADRMCSMCQEDKRLDYVSAGPLDDQSTSRPACYEKQLFAWSIRSAISNP